MTSPDAPKNKLPDTGMALFSAVFHQNPQAATLTRVSDGLLVEVNDAWLTLTGYTRAEVIGKTTVELGIWNATPRRDEVLAPIRTAQAPVNVELVLVTKSGTRRAVQFGGTHFLLHGVSHMLGFLRDVIVHHGPAQAMFERLEFIEKLIDRVPTLLYLLRVRPDGTRHIPYASPAIEQLFELSADEVMQDATPLFSKVHRDDVAALRDAITQSMRDSTPCRHEYRVVLSGKRVVWLYNDAMPQLQDDGAVIWYGSVIDITKRKTQLVELETTREQMAARAVELKVALDHMSDGILTLDVSGNITRCNQRFLELLDIPEAAMAGFTNGAELLQFQKERGDFGKNLAWVETGARPFIDAAAAHGGPTRYMRRTRAGRSLEVRSRSLPDGGMVRTFADVTHFVDARAALHDSEARFRDLTALSSDWYWEQDTEFRYVRVHGQAFDERKVGSESYLGRTHWDSGAFGLSDAQWAEHKRAVYAHETFRDLEIQRTDEKGHANWISISGAPVFDANGIFTGYHGVGHDITEKKRSEDENQRLAFYDTLTGLPNRRLLLDRMAQALVGSTRSNAHGALLFIDLDNFKDLNDTLGHDVGDQLLEKVANRLVTCIRQGDTVARFGGDEFVVMLEDLSSDLTGAINQVRTVGEKILSTLNLPFELSGKAHYSTPSIGVTMFVGQHQGVDELLKRSDLAMYQAKAAGRNTMRFFDPVMQAAVAQRAALEVDLRQGLERGELLLHYQAIMNQFGVIKGVEALVRWDHPVRGLVSPGHFIPAAEQTGLILPLGKWVLNTACQQLVAWRNDPFTQDITISVNISAREFRQGDFVVRILDTLKQTGANANRLKLELTESMLLGDVQDAINKMTELRTVGVRFSLDDFGTGYSSLAYLKRLPLDELKIDQSFVRDVLTDPNDAAIACTVVALAASMGLSVVAEGVESEGQRDFLARNGCQYFQGYLFGQPVPADELKLDSIVPGFPPTQAHILI